MSKISDFRFQISDLDSIDRSTHGFTRDGIPEAEDVVRIDVVEGFAIQKVNSERRVTLATVDLKLDFVPPSLINFISRQIIGSGFKRYQKVVAKVFDYDEDCSKALKDPMYTRIREVLYSVDMPSKSKEENELKIDTLQEHSSEDVQKSYDETEHRVQNGEIAYESIAEDAKVTDRKTFGEIEEDGIGENRQLKDVIKANEHKFNDDDDDDRVVDILQNSSLAKYRKIFGEIEEEESEYSSELENNDGNIDQTLTGRVAPKSPIN
ncbi:hypothetical protein OROMI_000742 [Orobanche minor]